MKKRDFKDYLLFKGDEIDNAAYALAVALLRTSSEQSNEEIIAWDMAVIASIIESAKTALEGAGKSVCWPYYEDEIPCCKSNTCHNKHCPNEKASNAEEA